MQIEIKPKCDSCPWLAFTQLNKIVEWLPAKPECDTYSDAASHFEGSKCHILHGASDAL